MLHAARRADGPADRRGEAFRNFINAPKYEYHK